MAFSRLPANAVMGIMDSFLEDSDTYEAWNLRFLNPTFAAVVHYKVFGPPYAHAMKALHRLREEEEAAIRGEEDFGDMDDDEPYRYDSDEAYSNIDFDALDIQALRPPAEPYNAKHWESLLDWQMLDHNLLAWIIVYKVNNPNSPHLTHIHHSLPRFFNCIVSFLLAFSRDRSTARKDTYWVQLCRAMCSACSLSDFSHYLGYGFEGDPFGPNLENLTSDPMILVAAAAAVGNFEAMKYAYKKAVFNLNPQWPDDGWMDRLLPSVPSSAGVYVTVEQMRTAARIYKFFVVDEKRNKVELPDLLEARELFGTPFEAATANGHGPIAAYILERAKWSHDRSGIRYQVATTIIRSMDRHKGRLIDQLIEWYYEACESGPRQSVVRGRRKEVMQWAAYYGCINSLHMGLAEFNLFTTMFRKDDVNFKFVLKLYHTACSRGHIDVVQYLFNSLRLHDKFDQYCVDDALREAVKGSWLQVTEFVLQKGANPSCDRSR